MADASLITQVIMSRALRISLFIGSLFYGGNCFCQDSLKIQHFVFIQHDNDFLNITGNETDEYYTGGFNLQYGFLNKSDNILTKILFAPGHTAYSFFKAGFTFWVYTPSEIDTNKVVQGDYPYSGTLFLNLSRETKIDPRKLFRSEFWLGVLGPTALGMQTQELIHQHIPSTEPLGWPTQLPDYPVFNYNLYYESNMASLSNKIKLNAELYTQMGSLINSAQAGFNLLFSSDPNNFFPEQVYSLDRKEYDRRGRFFIELEPVLRYVVTNSILQGGLFQEKNYYHISSDSLNRFVFEGSGTFGYHHNHLSLLYKETFQTAQFNSVHAHTFGSLIVIIRL
jgi:lipid A 3-O-deacylase